MHIGCDLDGVIIDHKRNQKILLKKYGFDIPENKISKDLIKSLFRPEQYEQFKNELYQGMGLSADEIEGAKEAVAYLAGAHDFRVISHRKNPQSARQWLKERGFNDFLPESRAHFVSVEEGKDEICKKFEVELHIDDFPEVLAVLTYPRHKILFGYDKPHPAATAVVRNWDEALRHIKGLYDSF